MTPDEPVDPAVLLRLEHAVADLVDLDADDVFRPLLTSIGTALRWQVGNAWVIDESEGEEPVLHRAAFWYADDFAAGADFAEASRDIGFEVGTGVPGRVWRAGKPIWIRDVRRDLGLPRRAAAERAGLAAAFCFPLVSRDGIEGFLEFFTDRVLDPAPDVLATATSLGRRVGDLLRRHRLDETIRRSEARLRAVLDAALDCVIIADATGRIIEFNPAACRTFGYDRDEAIGREMGALIVPPELRERHRNGLRRYVSSGETRALDRRIEITGMRRDGSRFPVELTITRVAMPGPPVFAGYVRDISERHRAEEELRAARHRVAEAVVEERQRLERDLHDGAQQRLISLALALVRARTALPGQPNRAAAMLDEAIVELEEAASELRDLARGIYPKTLTRFGLRAALDDVARRAPIDLELGTVPFDRYPLAVEATAYFVISEGLTNVARYAGTGRARVEVSVDERSAGSGALVVTIGDDGPGGASLNDGTGLRGLADRVAMLDGTLQLDSPLGGGTRLRARIPLPPRNVVPAQRRGS